jgi:hypothetical protein
MQERGTLVDELREIRSNLAEAIGVAEQTHRKLVGPMPKDTASMPKEPSESVVTIVGDIRRQTLQLREVLQMHHNVLGEVGDINAPRSLAGSRSIG